MKSGITAQFREFIALVPTWQGLKPYVLALVVVVNTGVILLYLSHSQHSEQVEKLLIDTDRDYRLMPFDMIDALRYCQLKTQSKYGDSLALSYVDEHSTRHELNSDLYKVFLVVHVGDLRDYEEEAVHCFVDPNRRMMTHYRTINLRKASIMSRAIKFFQ